MDYRDLKNENDESTGVNGFTGNSYNDKATVDGIEYSDSQSDYFDDNPDFSVLDNKRYIKTELGYLTEFEYQLRLKILKHEESIKAVPDRSFSRSPLILALFGLIFSYFVVGGILSVIGLAMSASRLNEKKSVTLVWARNISVCGLVMSIIALVFYVANSMNGAGL